MTTTTERRDDASPEATKTGAKKIDDLSYTAGVQGRPFVGCSACIFDLPPGGRGPCPSVPRAMLSVRTPRGVRQLCEPHAAGFLARGDSQNVDAISFSAGKPQ